MAFFDQFPKTTYQYQNDGVPTQIIDLFRYVKIDEDFLDDVSVYQFYQVKNGERPDTVSYKLYGTSEYYWTFFIANTHLKDGLSAWPLSPDQFEDYMNDEYGGVVIDTEPTVVLTGDGLVSEYRNSVAGRFQVNELVTGMISGATGYVKEKNAQMGQLILRDVTGTFVSGEFIRGATTLDEITSSVVYNHRDAPHHFETDDGTVLYMAKYINESNGDYSTGINVQPGTRPQDLTAISYFQYETQLNDERGNIRVVRPNVIYKFAQRFRELLNA